MHNRIQLTRRLYSFVFATALAACGGADESGTGGTAGAGGSTSCTPTPTACYAKCMCTKGATANSCLTQCSGAGGSGGSTSGTCGNGTPEGTEQCDGTNFNGETCAVATMGARTTGTLRCTASCTLDVSGCTGTTSFGGSGGTGTGGSGGTGFGGSGGTGFGGTGGRGGTGFGGSGGNP